MCKIQLQGDNTGLLNCHLNVVVVVRHHGVGGGDAEVLDGLLQVGVSNQVPPHGSARLLGSVIQLHNIVMKFCFKTIISSQTLRVKRIIAI